LKTIEDQLSGLEDKVPSKSLHYLKKKAFSDIRVDYLANDGNVSSDMPEVQTNSQASDIEQCMALTTVIVRSNIQALYTFFSELKENRNKKLTIKVIASLTA